jgi:hypothetical protein
MKLIKNDPASRAARSIAREIEGGDSRGNVLIITPASRPRSLRPTKSHTKKEK